jgi:hypothetical protein
MTNSAVASGAPSCSAIIVPESSKATWMPRPPGGRELQGGTVVLAEIGWRW